MAAIRRDPIPDTRVNLGPGALLALAFPGNARGRFQFGIFIKPPSYGDHGGHPGKGGHQFPARSVRPREAVAGPWPRPLRVPSGWAAMDHGPRVLSSDTARRRMAIQWTCQIEIAMEVKSQWFFDGFSDRGW